MATAGESNKHSSVRGWLVTFAGAGLGLVLGILYVWSVIKSGVPVTWGWSNADKALPYSLMCIVFSAFMVPAGRFQDRFGPRPAILVGGFLAGSGCIISGIGGSSVTVYLIGFGVLTGCGVGFAYSAATPAAVKWFPPARTGLIAGVVVAGFGLSPVLLAPISARLLRIFATTNPAGETELGVSSTMVTLGVVIWVVVGSLSRFFHNPPKNYVVSQNLRSAPQGEGLEFGWKDMLATAQFWLLYVMYFSGASAGLMLISVAQDLGRHALGQRAFFAVVVLAAGNTLGRILAGAVSDKVGRQWTLLGEFLGQGLVVAVLYWLNRIESLNRPLILTAIFLYGMNYGSNLALFPAACKDYFGIGNFGINYGWLFTAFGLAGFAMPWVNGRIIDTYGSLDLSFAIIVTMMVLSAFLAQISRRLGKPLHRSSRNNRSSMLITASNDQIISK